MTSNQNKNLALYKFEPFNKENLSKKIFANQPIQPIKGKPEMEKRAKRKPIKKETGVEYVNAFINEALLDPAHQLTPVITQVIDKETNHIKYFVKIEEEQSGKKETNTYYFELNSNNGSTDITPLIILNKIKASGKKNAVKPLTDSTNSFKKPSAKKRITS